VTVQPTPRSICNAGYDYISRDVRAVEWENPDNPGIGGSETAVVEVCRRLRARGHDVVVYGPILKGAPLSGWERDGCPFLRSITPDRDGGSSPGVLRSWTTSRSIIPDSTPHSYRKMCTMSTLRTNDGRSWTASLPLCPTHYRSRPKSTPSTPRKVCQGFNGIRTDMIREIESTNPPREPAQDHLRIVS